MVSTASKASTGASTSTGQQATPTSLQHDHQLQDKVGPRLKELLGIDSDTDSEREEDGSAKTKRAKSKKKSGRKRTAEDKVVKEQDWPHLYIYKGPARKAAEYENLSLSEFVQGCTCIIMECKEARTKDIMLQHLNELMEDCSDYGFEAVRNYHAIVLSEMEQNRLTWQDTEKIQRLRRQYAKKHCTKTMAAEAKGKVNETTTTACKSWNAGSCTKENGHDGKGHYGSYCITIGYKRKHQEKECRQR